MSLKQEIETWVAALAAYDVNEFDNALRCFVHIASTSKIFFNMGVIHATLGEHAQAVDCYQRAVQLDQYLAVAYFQQGVSNFLSGDFEEALANFNDTLLYLRGNNNIDYEQLGLKFKLYSCEVLFNRGLCYIYLQQKEAGMQDLLFASREKMVSDHGVIDEAIREQAEGYTVFSIPVGVVYRPNEAKVRNLQSRDFLGRARLVAQQTMNNGVDRQHTDPRRQAQLAALSLDDRPGGSLSYAALNLVRPELRSRGGRQQSEPPLHRNVFPPTPPPELERPISRTDTILSDPSSLRHSKPKPLRLELGAAAFAHTSSNTKTDSKPDTEKIRMPTRRTESERPMMRRDYTGGSIKRDRNSYREDGRVQEDPIVAYGEQTQAQQYPTQTPSGPVSGHQSALSNPRSSARHLSSQPAIEEEDDGDDDDARSDLPEMPPLAFEIIPPRPLPGQQQQKARAPKIPEMRKVRIKVHAEDMRYVMTIPSVQYQELCVQVRTKFGFTGDFRLKIRDEEGDLVTMADQDDLDMAMTICKTSAAKERVEMGKMEMWVQEM